MTTKNNVSERLVINKQKPSYQFIAIDVPIGTTYKQDNDGFVTIERKNRKTGELILFLRFNPDAIPNNAEFKINEKTKKTNSTAQAFTLKRAKSNRSGLTFWYTSALYPNGRRLGVNADFWKYFNNAIPTTQDDDDDDI